MALVRSEGAVDFTQLSSDSTNSDTQLTLAELFEREVELVESTEDCSVHSLVCLMQLGNIYAIVGQDLYERAIQAVTITIWDMDLAQVQDLSKCLHLHIVSRNFKEGETTLIANAYLAMALRFEDPDDRDICKLGILSIIKLLEAGAIEAFDAIRIFFKATKTAEENATDEDGYYLFDHNNLLPEDKFELHRTTPAIRRWEMARQLVFLMENLHNNIIEDDFHLTLHQENRSRLHERESRLCTQIEIFANELVSSYDYDDRTLDCLKDWKLRFWEEIRIKLREDRRKAHSSDKPDILKKINLMSLKINTTRQMNQPKATNNEK